MGMWTPSDAVGPVLPVSTRAGVLDVDEYSGLVRAIEALGADGRGFEIEASVRTRTAPLARPLTRRALPAGSGAARPRFRGLGMVGRRIELRAL